MGNQNTSIFQRPVWVSLLALSAAIAWGWAYPLIKIGFEEFNITQEMTGSKILFAGIRFAFSGLIILAIALLKRKRFEVKKKVDWGFILVFALMNTTFHYACFYIGLSHSQGAHAAILNSLGVFLLVIMACIFFKSDHLTMRKIVGCAIGLAGVFALNMGSGTSYHEFTFLGDGMIILNALCSATASLMTRSLGKRVDIFVGTGYSLALGGLLLVIPGIAMGGTLPAFTMTGMVCLLLLIFISAYGFAMYNNLISCNPVGKIAIYNSLIPVVGAVTSCMCLSEPFYWKYVIAGTLATAGIYIINKGKR